MRPTSTSKEETPQQSKMSTDLEFRQSLPQLRLPATRINDANVQSCGGDESHTPTSDEHKIPATLRCPPAPKKPNRPASCKRKLEFFEIAHRAEVESFFRLVDLNSGGVAIKRKFLPCT